ncbi:hypothetical protein GH877_30435, partial [Bacillus thuringiensis]|nr:hypothetical protein [Bacillus thuringiensis]
LAVVLLLLAGSCLSSATGITGGWTDVDVNNYEMIELAKTVVEQLNARSNSMFESILVTLKSGRVQVVQGLKYNLTLDVGTSDC